MKPQFADREPIAYHELGHVIAFTHFGYKVESVEIGDNFGCTVLPKQTVNAFHLIVACHGGKVAVDRWYGWKMPNDRGWRKSRDHKRAYDAALKMSRGDHVAAGLLMEWGERVATAIIEEQWSRFPDAVRLLVEHGRMEAA